MRTEPRFLDSNVLLYLIGSDNRKASIADKLVSGGATISVQVLNEFVSVARKKHSLGWDPIWRVLNAVRGKCDVVPVTLEMHDLAMRLAAENRINIYDALIVSAAQFARCPLLITEDMNHGQRIGRVTVRNPFL
jgi:predicted nucleic acid-binding protein